MEEIIINGKPYRKKSVGSGIPKNTKTQEISQKEPIKKANIAIVSLILAIVFPLLGLFLAIYAKKIAIQENDVNSLRILKIAMIISTILLIIPFIIILMVIPFITFLFQ